MDGTATSTCAAWPILVTVKRRRSVRTLSLTLGRSLENHDQSRIITRLASDHPSNRSKSGKLCCMLHTTLTGTLFIYQGQEIGMVNIPSEWGEEEYKDIEAVQNLQGERVYLEKQGVTGDEAMKDVLKSLRMTARDNGRTPMQVGWVGLGC